jgi:hypothetical protein
MRNWGKEKNVSKLHLGAMPAGRDFNVPLDLVTRSIAVLDAIIAAAGKELTNEQVGEAVGIDHTGGYFSNTIGPLSTAGLIVRRSGMVTPTDVLFPDGLR